MSQRDHHGNKNTEIQKKKKNFIFSLIYLIAVIIMIIIIIITSFPTRDHYKLFFVLIFEIIIL